MVKQRIYIGRHGKKASDGKSLDLTSFRELYEIGKSTLGDFVENLDYDRKNAFISHSDQKRTLNTGRLVLAGAFNMQLPRTEEELQSNDYQRFRDITDPGLSYTCLDINYDELKRLGEEAYLEWLVKNPDARELEHELITPWNQMLKVGRESLLHAVSYSDIIRSPLVAVVSHSGLTEPLILAAINSTRKYPITDPNTIGGFLPMQGYAIMNLENKKGILELNQTSYPVDLTNL
jgi:hypothetical protein